MNLSPHIPYNLFEIKTDSLVVIIKSKIYERFNPIDEGFVSLCGENICSLKVNGREYLLEGDKNNVSIPKIFFAESDYEIIVRSLCGKAVSLWNKEYTVRESVTAIDDLATMLTGIISFNKEGTYQFGIFLDGIRELSFEIQVYPAYISQKDGYRRLFSDCSEELYEKAVNLLRKDCNGDFDFLKIINRIFDTFKKSLCRVISAPYHISVAKYKNFKYKGFGKSRKFKTDFEYDILKNKEYKFAEFIVSETVLFLEEFEYKCSLEKEDYADIINCVRAFCIGIEKTANNFFKRTLPNYNAEADILPLSDMPCESKILLKNYLMLKHCLSIHGEIFRTCEAELNLKIADFENRNVLVGSVGSDEQLKLNLEDRFYYVPEKYANFDNGYPKYIAIFQSRYSFETGIRYYSEVLSVKKVKRSEIPVKLRRNNGDENYYLFLLGEWQILNVPIHIGTETVKSPRYTSEFLLKNSSSVYELFNIFSALEYRLLYEIKRVLDKPFSDGKFGLVRINENYFFTVSRGYFEIKDCELETIVRYPAESFVRDPKNAFLNIKKALLSIENKI